MAVAALGVDDRKQFTLRHADRHPTFLAVIFAGVEEVDSRAIGEDRASPFETDAVFRLVARFFSSSQSKTNMAGGQFLSRSETPRG